MIFGREPAFWLGLIATIILGAVRTIAGEGLISEAMAGQVNDFVDGTVEFLTLIAPLLAGIWIRFNVFSPATTQKIANRAATTGNTDIGDPPKGDVPGVPGS